MAIGQEPAPDGGGNGPDGGGGSPPASDDEERRKAFQERDAAKDEARTLGAKVLRMTYPGLTDADEAELAKKPRAEQEQAAKAMAFDRLQAQGGTTPTPPATPAATPAAAEPAAPASPVEPQVPAGAAGMGAPTGGPVTPAQPPNAEQTLVEAMRTAKNPAAFDRVIEDAQGQVRRGEIADPVRAYLDKGQR